MAGETVLVADDDQGIRLVLQQMLTRQGFNVEMANSVSGLWRLVEAGRGDLVITDVVMPDGDGLDLVPRMRKLRPNLKVIVMSARSTMMTALKASEHGAFDYLPKPFDINEMMAAVRRAFIEPSHPAVKPATGESDEELPLVGTSPAMQEVYRVMARLMKTTLTVMITGESGTGKELVARALHEFGTRRDGPFVAVNMAAIPRDLVESELFGHEKGAFTGATSRGIGRFEQADRGTLFLDEIGDMPIEAQTRLLRVLQEGEYARVGGRTPIRVNVRIIAATHHDLRALVAQGMFREDLFYRLNVVPIRLPALRERREDIPALVRHFLNQAVAEGLPQKTLDKAALDRLSEHGWPGNVRELENMIRRLCVLQADDVVSEDAVDAELAAASPRATEAASGGESLGMAVERHLLRYFAAHRDSLPANGLYERILREIERPLLTVSLSATRGNQLRAAELLGLNRNTLRKKIRELDIQIVRGLR